MTLPLHERIRREIEQRILTGALAPGDRLPTEAQLMADHGCARMTVNRALSALVQAGLIDRRKGAGSFVAGPRLHAMVLDIPDLAQEVARRGQAYGFRLLAREVRDSATKEEAALAAGGPLLAIVGLHLADGRALAFERRLVALAAVPAVAAADFSVEAPGSWLLRHVPWTEVETRIAAIGADREEAGLLGIAAGDPCLAIERRTWRGGEGITTVRQLFPGGAYDLVARFGSDRAARR